MGYIENVNLWPLFLALKSFLLTRALKGVKNRQFQLSYEMFYFDFLRTCMYSVLCYIKAPGYNSNIYMTATCTNKFPRMLEQHFH